MIRELNPAPPEGSELRKSFDNLIVVGGGCYGSYYVKQLLRARQAGALTFNRIIVPDKDPDCQVATSSYTTEERADIQVVVSEWEEFFDAYLGGAAAGVSAASGVSTAPGVSADSVQEPPDSCADAIVPSPLMPHLMYGWVLKRARSRWPDRKVSTAPISEEMPFPWQAAAPDGTRYGSFATWMCPINCIEPRKCPHTRGERSWSMPPAAAGFVSGSENLLGPVIFHCTHRAYGVGMFDTRDVLTGDRFIASAAADKAVRILVGTVSHCHGAFNVLQIER